MPELKNYLINSGDTSIISPEGIDPGFIRDRSLEFKPASLLFVLLSPLIIVWDNPVLISLLAFLYFLPAFGMTYLFQYLTNSPKPSKGLTIVGTIVLIGCIGIALCGTLILLIAVGLPLFQVITASFFTVSGIITGRRYYHHRNTPHPLKSQPDS